MTWNKIKIFFGGVVAGGSIRYFLSGEWGYGLAAVACGILIAFAKREYL